MWPQCWSVRDSARKEGPSAQERASRQLGVTFQHPLHRILSDFGVLYRPCVWLGQPSAIDPEAAELALTASWRMREVDPGGAREKRAIRTASEGIEPGKAADWATFHFYLISSRVGRSLNSGGLGVGLTSLLSLNSLEQEPHAPAHVHPPPRASRSQRPAWPHLTTRNSQTTPSQTMSTHSQTPITSRRRRRRGSYRRLRANAMVSAAQTRSQRTQ